MSSNYTIRSLAAVLLAAVIFGGLSACSGSSRSATRHDILFAADRAPRLDGEIYAVTLRGKQNNLSRSIYADTDPVVSPDGKRVAFLSGRAGYPAVYTVRIDGRGLSRVSPKLADAGTADWYWLSWSPEGTQLAAALSSTARQPASLYLLAPGQKPRQIAREPGSDDLSAIAWSPDGRLIAYERPGTTNVVSRIRIITPTGKRVFSAPGSYILGPQWSPKGRLAIQDQGRVRLYDDNGRLLAKVAGQTFSFSANGQRLATMFGSRLEVRDEGGSGALVLSEKVVPASVRKLLDGDYQPEISWAGADRVLVSPQGSVNRINFAFAPALSVDIPSGHVGRVSFGVWLSRQTCTWMGDSCGSPDHSMIVETPLVGHKTVLRVARVDGSGSRQLAIVPACLWKGSFEGSIADLQFLPGGRALVYRTVCVSLYSNLYSISPNGSGLRRLTKVDRDQASPTRSPDGRRIAYASFSDDWPANIWVWDIAGNDRRQLTFLSGQRWDTSPSWSPDGRELLYGHAESDSSTLFVIPATGGSTHSLGIHGGSPAWGPDRIVYLDNQDDVWTAAPDGTDRHRITSAGENGPWASSPAWSKDGRLAWISTSSDEKISIELLAPSGQRSSFPLSELVRVETLAWSEDGHGLVLTAAPPEGPSDLYTISDDGRGLRKLTNGLGVNSASWR